VVAEAQEVEAEAQEVEAEAATGGAAGEVAGAAAEAAGEAEERLAARSRLGCSHRQERRYSNGHPTIFRSWRRRFMRP